MASPASSVFDPYELLGALQARNVSFIVIGAFARVVHGTGEVVQTPVGVACGQNRAVVPGQFLQGAQVDPRPTAQRQVGVPQGMEVGAQPAVRPLGHVGDAGGLQVPAQHLGALVVPCPRSAP